MINSKYYLTLCFFTKVDDSTIKIILPRIFEMIFNKISNKLVNSDKKKANKGKNDKINYKLSLTNQQIMPYKTYYKRKVVKFNYATYEFECDGSYLNIIRKELELQRKSKKSIVKFIIVNAKNKINTNDAIYWDPFTLKNYLYDSKRIISSALTHTKKIKQKSISKNIKRARTLGLISPK